MKMKSLQQIYLGEFQVVPNRKKNYQEMVIKRKTNKSEEMRNQIINLQNRQKISHQNLIQLKKYEEQKISQLCATFYEVRAFYEYFPNNLHREILRRRKNQNYFSAVQLLRFIYDTVDVFQYLESKGIKHNELNPLLLFVTEDQQNLQRIKVSERLNGYSNSLANAYDALNSNLNIYLDPQSFEDLTQGKKFSTSDPFKIDVFSLGVIFLEAGLLKSSQKIYDILGGQFQYQLLEQLFEQFQKIYSKNTLLLSVVSKMLEINQDQRPQFQEIKEALPDWSQVYQTTLNHYDPHKNNLTQEVSSKKLYPVQSQKKIFEESNIEEKNQTINQNNIEQDFEQLQTEKSFDDFVPEEIKNNYKSKNFQKQNKNLIVSHETQDLRIFGLQEKKKQKNYKKQQLYQFTQSKTLTQSQKQISISSNPNYFFKRGSHKNQLENNQSLQWEEIDFANAQQNNLKFEVPQSPENEFSPQKNQATYQPDQYGNYDKTQRESQRTIIREEVAKDNNEIFEHNNIPKYCKSENGMIYKSVINEKDEYNDQGQLIRRVYVSYEPLNNNDEMIQYQNYQQKQNQQQNNLQKQLDPIKETYSDTFNTLDQQKQQQYNNLKSSIQVPFQNHENIFNLNNENKNRQNQSMYETDFFNVSQENKKQQKPEESFQDFFQSIDDSQSRILQSPNKFQQEFPQIDINQFNEIQKTPQKNPYIKQNKVKQNLADMLREYKENEDYYNSSLKAKKRYVQNQFN